MQLSKREEHLLPLYHQVAIQFADLHDTAGRMQKKGVINVRSHTLHACLTSNFLQGIVSWRHSRKRFYWRLRRRLLEERIRSRVRASMQVSYYTQDARMTCRNSVELTTAFVFIDKLE